MVKILNKEFGSFSHTSKGFSQQSAPHKEVEIKLANS